MVIGVLLLLAAACSAGDGEESADGGDSGQVRTADAASASAGRRSVIERSDEDGTADPEAGREDRDGATTGSGDEGEGPDDSGPADGDAAMTDGSTRPEGSADDEPPAEVVVYPEITEEIVPASGGVTAVLSPSGVLLGVTGQTAGGYVVETPCGGVTTLPWGQPVTGIQVVLDAGHGGDEAGADSAPGLTEAELNLALARRAAAELTGRSISVILTRNGDYRIPISRRAALADAVGPRILVSIHHNTPASRPSAQPGTEVYVQNNSDDSRRLGGLLYEEVFAALSEFDVEWTSRDDAGVLTVLNDDDEDAYGIARYPTTTSALIEMAYLGNDKEAALLITDDYLTAGAEALASGIERFLTTEDPGTGFVATPRVFNPSGDTGGSDGCIDPPLE